jgi:hypothetical protein
MGKAAHRSIVTICMHSGVTHPSHKTKYKSITVVKLAQLKITVDQEQHHHTTNSNIKNTITSKIISPPLNHHHTINPAHVLSNMEDSHPSTSSNKPSSKAKDQHGHIVQLGTRSSSSEE